jgi:hypothetical protein
MLTPPSSFSLANPETTAPVAPPLKQGKLPEIPENQHAFRREIHVPRQDDLRYTSRRGVWRPLGA